MVTRRVKVERSALDRALITALIVLFGFFTWAASRWVEDVEAQLKTVKNTQVDIRIETLQRLARIDEKLENIQHAINAN